MGGFVKYSTGAVRLPKPMQDKPQSDAAAAHYDEAFSRNIGLHTEEEQNVLRNTTIAIAGLGGVGGIYATSLARLGIGGFHLCDPDTFALVNTNRQAGATNSTLGKSKSEVLASMIRDINPHARVSVFGADTASHNAFLRDVDAVIDGIDFFEMAARRALHASARKRNLHVFAAAPVGHGASLLVFDPRGMGFDEYFDVTDKTDPECQILHFGLGLTPALLQRSYFDPTKISFKKRAAPSLVSGTLLAANLVVCELTKLLLKRNNMTIVPNSIHFDPYVRAVKRVRSTRGNRSLVQRLKIWYVKRAFRHLQAAS